MLSGNGTIDYDVGDHTLGYYKASAAHQELTTRNCLVAHNSVCMVVLLITYIVAPLANSKSLITKQVKIISLQGRIESSDRKLMGE